MHILQSPNWSRFKSQFGWTSQAVQLLGNSVPAQLLFRRLPGGLKFAYVPKGPAVDWQNLAEAKYALKTLKQAARKRGVIFLKIEPDATCNPALKQIFYQAGFIDGKTVQPRTTIIIDITPDEETILAAMKSKTRYNIRLAGRKGVTVREGAFDDLTIFHQLSQVTAQRDGFAIHPLAYYQAAFQQFSSQRRALLLAEFENQPLAGLMVFAWDGRAYYLYGASNNRHRNKMPAYLLQWEAIKWAKVHNCHTYDLWGIPDASPEALEAKFSSRRDGLWGVYRFKRGFGGQVVRSAGAFDIVYNQPLYKLFTTLLERRAE